MDTKCHLHYNDQKHHELRKYLNRGILKPCVAHFKYASGLFAITIKCLEQIWEQSYLPVKEQTLSKMCEGKIFFSVGPLKRVNCKLMNANDISSTIRLIKEIQCNKKHLCLFIDVHISLQEKKNY